MLEVIMQEVHVIYISFTYKTTLHVIRIFQGGGGVEGGGDDDDADDDDDDQLLRLYVVISC